MKSLPITSHVPSSLHGSAYQPLSMCCPNTVEHCQCGRLDEEGRATCALAFPSPLNPPSTVAPPHHDKFQFSEFWFRNDRPAEGSSPSALWPVQSSPGRPFCVRCPMVNIPNVQWSNDMQWHVLPVTHSKANIHIGVCGTLMNSACNQRRLG